MKSKFLKLEKPCQEKWENMKPNKLGNYCDLCSKNVIDFTQLSQFEISRRIKNTDENICARITQSQLNTPLFDFEDRKRIGFPYAKVAASLMIATALTAGHGAQAENLTIQKEFVQTSNSTIEVEKVSSKKKPTNTSAKDFCIVKGIVTTENGEPVENAKITYISLEKILFTHSLENGSFLLEIPTELVDDDNVIRVSYDEIKQPTEKEIHWGFETKDYVLSKEEMNSLFEVKAFPVVLILGGIGHYSEQKEPIVLLDGEEIKYSEFIKARQGKKSNCNIENKDFYYFASKEAVALYGQKAKHGLYILTSN